MATIQADNIVAIVVDRGTREVLRNCLRSEAYQLESFEGAIHGSDRAVAHEALARAVHVVDTFDQLGWEDDDPRERYEITVALDSFVPWLRGQRRDLAESLVYQTTDMTAVRHDEVFGWRRELKAIEALLERLDSAGAVG